MKQPIYMLADVFTHVMFNGTSTESRLNPAHGYFTSHTSALNAVIHDVTYQGDSMEIVPIGRASR